ncbi:MAG: Eco29kI family restriction endonuclease [Rhizobacter sp.]
MSGAKILPFNPLDKRNLGASVAEALVGRKATSLAALSPFNGVGIYAIYYHGSFEAYERIAQPNLSDQERPVMPIYVGKAVPSGSRKGKELADPLTTTALYRRLSEHAESIRLAKNLNVVDFTCRYLVVDEIWIPLGESLMIAKFAPLWNQFVDGFGNHDPGSGRYQGQRPRWDVLHPGRTWAEKCKARTESLPDIVRDVRNHLNNLHVPHTPHFIGPDE